MKEPPREENEAQFMPLDADERKARMPGRDANRGCLWAFVAMLVAVASLIVVMFDTFVWRP
jgi:hypothetical protein